MIMLLYYRLLMDFREVPMKSYFKFLIFSLVVSGLTLLAPPFQCKGETENNNQEAENAFTRGAKAWMENCTTCHNSRAPQEFRPDQWRTIMAHMRVVAKLSGQTARDILAFLTGEIETGSAQLSETLECPEEIGKEVKSNEEPSKEDQLDQTKPSETKPSEMKPSEVKVAFKEHPVEKAASQSESSDLESLYNKNCAMCHGNDGRGTILGGAPDFTSSSSPLKTSSEETIFKRINDGYHTMPPANPEITDDQIRQLIKHMKRKFAN